MIILYATLKERFKMANSTEEASRKRAIRVGTKNPVSPPSDEIQSLIQATSWVDSPRLIKVRVRELCFATKHTLITTSSNLLRSNGWGKRELIKWTRHLQARPMDKSIELVKSLVIEWERACPMK